MQFSPTYGLYVSLDVYLERIEDGSELCNFVRSTGYLDAITIMKVYTLYLAPGCQNPGARHAEATSQLDGISDHLE